MTQEHFAGSLAVLAFYPMAFTGGERSRCGASRPRAELEALGARVAGVSTDIWAAQEAFARECGVEFPLLSDWPSYATVKVFGVLRDHSPVAVRSTFVFDRAGIIRAVISDAPNVQAHVDGALVAVRELAAGE